MVMYGGRVVETGAGARCSTPAASLHRGLLRSIPRSTTRRTKAVRHRGPAHRRTCKTCRGLPFHPRCALRLDLCDAAARHAEVRRRAPLELFAMLGRYHSGRGGEASNAAAANRACRSATEGAISAITAPGLLRRWSAT